MVQLEEKTYTKAELGQILGFNAKDKNFKRNVENTLKKWRYEYEFPPYSKTITITYVPEGEDKLAELLVREYGLDVQTEAADFACFIHAFNYIEGFHSMPWAERTRVISETYGVNVCDKTLRNWANKLLADGVIMKNDYQKTYWKSAKISSIETIREPAEKSEFVAFYKYRSEEYRKNINKLIMEESVELDKVRAEAYRLAHFAAMSKFGGWCYYSCKSFELSAFDDKSLQEIFEIVEEIAPCFIDYKEQEDRELELVQQEKERQVQQEINQKINNNEFVF